MSTAFNSYSVLTMGASRAQRMLPCCASLLLVACAQATPRSLDMSSDPSLRSAVAADAGDVRGASAINTVPSADATPTRLPDASPAKRDAGAPGPGDAGLRADAAEGRVQSVAAFPTRGPVVVSYTTLDQHGNFSPKNIGVSWIEDGSGNFIKTLEVWAWARRGMLTAWNASSGGNVMDAVTSATQSSYGARQVTWDMTDTLHNPVPDADYVLKIEFTDEGPGGPVYTIPIHKGPDSIDGTAPDKQYVVKISIDYQ